MANTTGVMAGVMLLHPILQMNTESKPNLYDELAPKVGHENHMRAFNHVESLIAELIQLIPEADAWGADNGYPEVENYPHYQRARQIGTEFSKLAGIRGMQSAISSTQKRLNDYPPMKYSYAILVYGWSEIDGWQP